MPRTCFWVEFHSVFTCVSVGYLAFLGPEKGKGKGKNRSSREVLLSGLMEGLQVTSYLCTMDALGEPGGAYRR